MRRMGTRPQPVDYGILLAQAYQSFVRQLRAHLAAEGFDDLGRSDGFVLRELGRQPMTVSRLAQRLDITKQGAAQVVDDMRRRGYLRRRPDPTDLRAQLVELSPRGTAALAAASRFHRAYERGLAHEHGPAAVATVRAVLTGMTADAPDGVDPRLRPLYF
jgi:DNA-binding MarR family transcriptional regulator